MKVSTPSVLLGLLLLEPQHAAAFAPAKRLTTTGRTRSMSSRGGGRQPHMTMAMDMPPPAAAVSEPQPVADVPVIQKNARGPTSVRYSDFLKLINADQVEKVTFSSDGSQLIGVDVDGTRIMLEALPNDPTLLDQLTQHKVRSYFSSFKHSTHILYIGI